MALASSDGWPRRESANRETFARLRRQIVREAWINCRACRWRDSRDLLLGTRSALEKPYFKKYLSQSPTIQTPCFITFRVWIAACVLPEYFYGRGSLDYSISFLPCDARNSETAPSGVESQLFFIQNTTQLCISIQWPFVTSQSMTSSNRRVRTTHVHVNASKASGLTPVLICDRTASTPRADHWRHRKSITLSKNMSLKFFCDFIVA